MKDIQNSSLSCWWIILLFMKVEQNQVLAWIQRERKVVDRKFKTCTCEAPLSSAEVSGINWGL